ncbi:MAG: excinuclease ABC subunit UvrC [Actinomycetota bacterium]|nr:excinuclease ABC subunit UvrC [Actinomycetota bacterium]
MANTALVNEVKNLPDKPGVYLFKNEGGLVLYIGKAKSLKKRVRSYFTKNTSLPKVKLMVAQAAKLDYHVTATEVEALVFEANLIKRYRPKYNVSYRDDKSYPYLAVCSRESWPRVKYTREKHRADTRYFGPYTGARALRETLDTLMKIFPLRACSNTVMARAEKTGRPCLYFHIDRCPGPCVGRADAKEYGRTLEQLCAFLEGRQEQVIADLNREMEAASRHLAFERAALFRDRIRTAAQILEKQRVAADTRLNQDIFGLEVEDELGCIQLLKVRAGKLIGSEDFIVDEAGGCEAKEVITSFVKQYYEELTAFPDEVVLPRRLDEPGAIAVWLGTMKGRTIKLTVPSRGAKKRLVEMAMENAVHSLARFKLRSGHEAKSIKAGLDELQKALGLPQVPAAIECFDISTISGAHSVGSMVVFLSGRPARQHYRRFKIRSAAGEPNDFAMMKEVVSRRLKHAGGDAKFAALPDLVLVDGGKPQLTAALEALEAAGVAGVPAAALAKKREELFLPGRDEPVLLPEGSQGLYLIQRIRDEAHRFAIAYHRQLRADTMRGSSLDSLPGIGPKRRQMLLKKFGSLKKVKAAGEDELVAAGLPRALAKSLRYMLS